MGIVWPAADGDLLGPMQGVLEGIAVLETKEDQSSAEKKENSLLSFTQATTPYSLQVITAGALAFSQQAAKVVAGLGGVTAILAAIKGIWYTSNSTEAAAMVGGAAFVLAALFVALAVIVRSDVQARSLAQAAEYQARARVAATFLEGTEGRKANASEEVRMYWLRRSGLQAFQAVDHFEVRGNGFVAVLADQTKTEVPPNEIDVVIYASVVS